MSALARQEQIDGKWFAWIVTEGFNTMMLEVDHELTEAEALDKQAEWQAAQVPAEPTDGATE